MKLSVLQLILGRIFLSCCLISKVSCEELYVGCYGGVLGWLAKTNILSVAQCLAECRNQTLAFAAIKDGSSCYCGGFYLPDTRVPSSKCNLLCSDNSKTCGGTNLFAIYADVPTYGGCFVDAVTSVPNQVFRSNVFDSCYDLCNSGGYDFMATKASNECFCARIFGNYIKAPESQCDKTCEGNGNEICGGQYRSSVYYVGYFPGLNQMYREVFHCLGGTTDRNGTCISKTCQQGWKGTKCNFRDCSVNNGYCGQHKCEDIKIGNQNISECVCNEGFQSISVRHNCTDIDECLQSVCNFRTSFCKNNIGSYECVCKEGYGKNLANECVDIDECLRCPCNELSQICINTNGSFMCISTPGHNYTNQADCAKNSSNPSIKHQNITCNGCDVLSQPLSEGKRDVILATFLALFMIFSVISASGMALYRNKFRKLKGELDNLQSNIENGQLAKPTYAELKAKDIDIHHYNELARK